MTGVDRGHVTGRAVAASATEDGRRPVLHDADLLRGAAVHPQEQPSGSLGHDDHALRLLAQRGEHVALVVRRLRQDGVKRQDERSSELFRERQHVLAVGTAEDPVLVLQQHDVDVEAPQEPCRADVVAPHALRHGCEDVMPLRARGLIDDRDCPDALHTRNLRAATCARRTRRFRSRTRAAGTSRRSQYAR